MPFIVGRASQEDELYRRYKDFITGVAWQNKLEYSGTGNGKMLDIRVQEGYEYETFTVTCYSESDKGGHFSVEGDISGPMAVASVNQVYHQNQIQFYLDYGTNDFKVGDTFTVSSRSASDHNKPVFESVVPRKSETQTVTLTCTEPGNSLNPALFSVQSTANIPYESYIQGQTYSTNEFQFTLPYNPSDTHFVVGDTLSFHLQENELTALEQEWECVWNVEQDLPQFGKDVGSNDRFAVFKGQGLAGQDDIYFMTRRIWDDANEWANWDLSWTTGVRPGHDWQDQPGVMDTNLPIHQMWSGELHYWIIANGRRVIMVTKSSNFYHQSYQGMYLPYATKDYEPYPVMTGGSGCTVLRRWNDTSSRTAPLYAFWHPCATSADRSPLRLLDFKSEEVQFRNYSINTTNGTTAWIIGRQYEVFPHAHNGTVGLRENLDGTVPAFRACLYPHFGEMDGVYIIPQSTNTQAEDILDYGDRKLLTVPNVFRSGSQDFAAMELS